jgi:proteic killer suppression protein
MIVTFEKEYLRDLHETGQVDDKKYHFKPDVIKRYKRRIKMLQDAERIDELIVINSLNYEVSKGDKAGISSIRVNKQYCIEFMVTDNSVATVCTILELSNNCK